jgi:hypothetical protein
MSCSAKRCAWRYHYWGAFEIVIMTNKLRAENSTSWFGIWQIDNATLHQCFWRVMFLVSIIVVMPCVLSYFLCLQEPFFFFSNRLRQLLNDERCPCAKANVSEARVGEDFVWRIRVHRCRHRREQRSDVRCRHLPTGKTRNLLYLLFRWRLARAVVLLPSSVLRRLDLELCSSPHVLELERARRTESHSLFWASWKVRARGCVWACCACWRIDS